MQHFETQLRQTQALLPHMYQSLRLLQMNILQLSEHIEQLLLENPLLEENESFSGVSFYDGEYDFEQVSTSDIAETLQEHLALQFDVSLTGEESALLTYIVGNLNSAGYLNLTPGEIAVRTGYDEEIVSYAISYLQTLEPAGICAMNLSDCLTIQLKRMGYSDPVYYYIVLNYLEKMAKGHFTQIAKELRCSTSDVSQACGVIRMLDPKPGSAFGVDSPRYVLPDIRVTVDDDRVTASMLDTRHTCLNINHYYSNLAKHELDDNTSKFLSEKLNQAKWLMETMSLRKKTIQNIVDMVIEVQKEFFISGGALVPLSLDDAVSRLGTHKSTISRAINGKTIECSQGIIPLHRFFSIPVGKKKDTSRDAVKKRIKELIATESEGRPLSDSDLVELFAAEGIQVSRRVLAKYRSEMNIPGVFARKAVNL